MRGRVSCPTCRAFGPAGRADIARKTDEAKVSAAPPQTLDVSGCTCNRPKGVLRATWARSARRPDLGIEITHTRDELRASLANPIAHAGDKSTLPLISWARYVRPCRVVRTDDLPCRCTGYHRALVNVASVTMLGLDIDDGDGAGGVGVADPDATLATVASALGGVEVYACSSFSARPGAWKVRLLVPYDRPATADEHHASWDLVARVLADAGIAIDRKCRDASRGFYVWAHPPSGAYWHAHVGGVPWPVEVASAAEQGRAAELRMRAERARIVRRVGSRSRLLPIERAARYVDAMPPAVQGQDGSGALWRVAWRLAQHFRVDDAQAWPILLAYSARCLPPWSERELRHTWARAQRARVNHPGSHA